MRKLKVSNVWVLVFLLAATMAGCSDGDKHSGNPGDPLTPPSATGVTPTNGTTPICPNTALVTAIFSKPMHAQTINNSTFTLTSGGTSVSGGVSYVAATNTATFTPLAPLAASTTFTATITTAAQDLYGNGLATNFVWMFTTSAACPPPSAGGLALGAACRFGILAGSTVTNVAGTATTVSGDVGVSPGTAITGFGSPASITGAFHSNDSIAMTAQGDLTTAYNNAAGAAGGAVLAPDIGGLTLPPGVYKTTSAQPSLGITGILTLDGKGDPNAIWIFQIVSTLTTAATNSQVVLINGASAHNVLWQVGSSATLGTTTTFAGTIMAQASITITTGATLNGRALARTGAVHTGYQYGHRTYMSLRYLLEGRLEAGPLTVRLEKYCTFYRVRRNFSMSSQSKNYRAWSLTILPVMIAMLCTLASFAAAQDQPAPKWELYGGYSFFYPNTDVHGQLPGAVLPLSSRLESNPRGAGASATYNFNRWFGLTLDASTNWGSGEKGLANRIDDAAFSNISFGPKITYRTRHFSPFFEVLVGDHRLTPDAFHDVDRLGVMVGGGLDVNLSRHFALRLLRADYVISNYRFAPPTVSSTDLRGVRLQTGINFMFGGGEPPPPSSATCSLQPTEVFAGEPVTATSHASNFSPKRTVKYSWSGSGVKVAGSDASAQVDTTGLQPGSYVVTASLSDGSKNGLASCRAGFTVKQPHPPVISCSADPASVQLGGQSTISSNASSPDGRRLIYSYAASAGDIAGNGSSAVLNTSGAQPGPIQITCNVGDDRIPPLTASSTVTVTVQAPPPPAPAPEIKQLESKLALHSIYFATARPTIAHPERGLVDSQAEILEALATDFKSYLKYMPEAHLILSGHADPRGSVEYNKALSERRVERTKSFLVEHGVPADHIETRAFGKEDQLTSAQIKEQMTDNPDLTPEERQQMMKNLTVLVLANNRRVDVTLSTTGQQSLRRYPFNAKDFLALVNTKGVETKTKVGETKHPAKKQKP